MTRNSIDEFAYCQELLAKASVSQKKPGCLVCSGPVTEDGFIQIKVNGEQYYVHRFVALYHVKRTPEQIANLKKYKVRQTCGVTACINPAHLEFDERKKHKEFIPLTVASEGLRQVVKIGS